MRCLACNALMSDFEATRKSVNTNEYIDLCNHCYYSISDDVNALERTDLEHEEDMWLMIASLIPWIWMLTIWIEYAIINTK